MSETYRTLSVSTLPPYLATLPGVPDRLGGGPSDWSVREVSDGNLNSVFLVEGPAGSLCVKQSLPHVRVDPSWRMPLDRTAFEAAWLAEVRPHAGPLVPEPIHFDPAQFCLVMERLHPHVSLREALITGTEIPRLAETVARFVALCAFNTSLLGQSFEPVMRRIARFSGNTTLTRITVDLVMTDPFEQNGRNRIPEGLEAEAAGLRDDPALRTAAARLKRRFFQSPQALLHGDLHTGSLMVAPSSGDIRVIDGEFALMGPIGFDLGLFLANLLLNHAAQPGLQPDGRATPFRRWLIGEADRLFRSFAVELRTLCDDAVDSDLLRWPETGATLVAELLAEVEADMIGFAGLEMIRRTVGFAHVADLDSIADAERATAARRTALAVGRTLLATTKHPASFASLVDVSVSPDRTATDR